MLEFYLPIRLAHIFAISLSGALFFLRSISSILGAKWPHLFAVRMVVYLIDIILLTAAAILLTILPKEIFANGWLWVKLILVFLYILSGFGAMRTKSKKPTRIGFMVLSAIIYITIIGIALHHNPLGWFA